MQPTFIYVLKVKGLIYNYKACVHCRSAKLRSVNSKYYVNMQIDVLR